MTRPNLTSATATQATPDYYCANSHVTTMAVPSKRLNIDLKKACALTQHVAQLDATSASSSSQNMDESVAPITYSSNWCQTGFSTAQRKNLYKRTRRRTCNYNTGQESAPRRSWDFSHRTTFRPFKEYMPPPNRTVWRCEVLHRM